jgi:hypothetical protein
MGFGEDWTMNKKEGEGGRRKEKKGGEGRKREGEKEGETIFFFDCSRSGFEATTDGFWGRLDHEHRRGRPTGSTFRSSE